MQTSTLSNIGRPLHYRHHFHHHLHHSFDLDIAIIMLSGYDASFKYIMDQRSLGIVSLRTLHSDIPSIAH